MKKINQIKTILSTALTLCSTLAFAGQVGTLNNFVAGQPAVAAAVNKNFTDLKTEINNNDTRISNTHVTYDIKDYLSSATTKAFSINFGNGNGDQGCNAILEVHSFQRTQNGNDTTIVKTSTQNTTDPIDAANQVCLELVQTYNLTLEELLFVSNARTTLNSTESNLVTFDTPITQFTSTMEIGKTTGDADYRTSIGSVTQIPVRSSFAYSATLLKVEPTLTLTVNGASKIFTNCLIFKIDRNARIYNDWYCPGEGLVKRTGSPSLTLTTTVP